MFRKAKFNLTEQSLNDIAIFYSDQRRYGEAEPLFRRAIALCEQRLGTDHPATTTSLNNLACLYRNQGRFSEAEPLYARALAICEKQLGADHPTTKIVRSNYQAFLYVRAGDLDTSS